MSTIGNFPFLQARFNKKGALIGAPAPLPAGITDLFVVSHGWRNDEQEADKLYRDLFTHFANPQVVDPAKLAGRKCAILGVYWPSKNFDALIAAQGGGKPGNAAAFGDIKSDDASQKALVKRLEEFKESGLFDEPDEKKVLDQAIALVPDLDDKQTAREAFVNLLRGLLDPLAATKEDASDIFLKMAGEDVFKRLNIAAVNVDAAVAKSANAQAFVGVAAPVAPPAGKAVGLLDIFKGAAAAASNVVSYFSYYLMKERAGTVGQKGLAPLIDQWAPQVTRLHLVGHSFGGRLIAATAAHSTNAKIHSASFLQAAFSHNGFSPPNEMNGLFRPVIDQQRVKGPLLATHTKNDTAVGIAYPLASRLSGTVASALGDENDKYGGLGRNGAQKMNPGEVIKGNLLPVGGSYAFTAGKFHNLHADAFIPDHGGVTGPEVAAAIASAAF
jgi:hypothetical protein